MQPAHPLLCRLLIFSFASARYLTAADEIIAVKAARLFDGKAKALVTNGVVIVQGDKIVDAGSGLPILASSRAPPARWASK